MERDRVNNIKPKMKIDGDTEKDQKKEEGTLESKGIVYLVGAGPGDLELLTIKGRRLIDECDVIVYDRLVSEDILALIPEGKKLINVGKNAGDHPVPQDEINRILVREAKLGQKVLRLKGGDPFVFGRGGEELELITEEGIPFEVVPGITSSISAPAYGGIPVTHRDYCSSFHIITGHARQGKELDIDFESLVGTKGTLIFMMSVSSSKVIAEGLLKAGIDPNMPAAFVENGTRSNQRTIITTVENLSKAAEENKVKSPAVIVVGKVCSLGEEFSWFEKRPLRGKTIMVTQPQKRSSCLAGKLRELGANVITYPCIRTVSFHEIEPPFEDFTHLFFTSREGVEYFFDYFRKNGLDARALAGKKIAVVGAGTRDELAKYSIIADFMPKTYHVKYLAEEALENGFVVPHTSKVLLLRAEQGSKDINEIFDEAGVSYLDYPIYKTEYINQSPVKMDGIDYITFTSRSCVEGFVKSCGLTDFEGINALCIGSQTGRLAESYGFNCYYSKEATIPSMVERLLELEVENE